MTLAANFSEAKKQKNALAKINTIKQYYFTSSNISIEAILNGLTPEMLCTKVKEADNATPLWWLIYAASQRHLHTSQYTLDVERLESGPLSRVFEQFKEQLTVDDFLTAPNSQSTGLCLLALLSHLGPDRPMMMFFKQFQDKLKLEHFFAPDKKGTTPLFWLIGSGIGLQVINFILQKWGKIITPAELQAKVKEDGSVHYTGKSIQYLIMFYATVNRPAMQPIVEALLRHVPEIFTDEDMAERPQRGVSMQDLLQDPKDRDREWRDKITKWIRARNAFFKTVEALKTKKKLENADFEELRDKSSAAFEAGFIEAPLYLGDFLEEKVPGDIVEHIEAYSLVPNDSWHFEQTMERMANICLTQAIISFPDSREGYLKKALEFAIKLSANEPMLSRPLLAQIAACAITEGKSTEFNMPLPSSLLEIDANESIPLFFALCSQIRYTIEVADRVMQLERKIREMQLGSVANAASSDTFTSQIAPASPLTPQFVATVASRAAASFDSGLVPDQPSPQPNSQKDALFR